MRHRNTGKVLSREQAPRKALLRGLATSVVLYEKIRTTHAKAHAVQPLVERMITLAKAKTPASTRRMGETGMTNVYCPVCGECCAMVEGDGPTREERYGITPPCCFLERFHLLQVNQAQTEQQISDTICARKQEPSK